MVQYIDKSKVVAEIEKMKKKAYPNSDWNHGYVTSCEKILSFIDTFEVKDVDTWHLQEKENIYDAVKDWSLHTFACVMKDGTIQKFSGSLDEDYEGHINVHIDGDNDDYDDVDDIVKWIEIM